MKEQTASIDYGRSEDIRDIFKEDVKCLGALLKQYYSCEGKEFIELESFFDDQSSVLNDYLAFIQDVEGSPVIKAAEANEVSVKDFKTLQEKHIEQLQEATPKASKVVISFKKKMLARM